jgi:hypothetical protein
MARVIAEIKREITSHFMSQEIIQQYYGFAGGAEFENTFSKASLENIMFYVVAASIWTLEKLFDAHKVEIESIVRGLKPHTRQWYALKAKSFLLGKALVPDTDYYDTSGMSDEDIAAAQIVKYAAVVETAGTVYIKIATETAGEPAPLSEEEYTAFTTYMDEVRDAGVVIEVINEPGEYFRIRMSIFYDAMVMDNTGTTFSGATPVQDTIKKFIGDLPFNGEYRNIALVNALQKIEGVVIPEIHLAETSRDGVEWHGVDVKAVPYSGYYKIYDDADMNIAFIPYETSN